MNMAQKANVFFGAFFCGISILLGAYPISFRRAAQVELGAEAIEEKGLQKAITSAEPWSQRSEIEAKSSSSSSR